MPGRSRAEEGDPRSTDPVLGKCVWNRNGDTRSGIPPNWLLWSASGRPSAASCYRTPNSGAGAEQPCSQKQQSSWAERSDLRPKNALDTGTRAWPQLQLKTARVRVQTLTQHVLRSAGTARGPSCLRSEPASSCAWLDRRLSTVPAGADPPLPLCSADTGAVVVRRSYCDRTFGCS
jgi:hypothetical protein